MRAVSFREDGFTIAELEIVIILIGILSVLGIGLIVPPPSAYSASAAGDQFVSSVLLAHKRALADSAGSTMLTLQ